MLPGSIGTERFTCPKCGLGYQAIKEWFPDDVSGGRFECIECFAEVHSWTGLYDYIGLHLVVHQGPKACSVHFTVSATCRISFVCAQARIEAE